jgi:hypothetical protein
MRSSLRLKNKIFYIFLSAFIILISSFLIGPNKNIFAQGTCWCETDTTNPICIWHSSCVAGYYPDCTYPSCTAPCHCIGPTPTPSGNVDWGALYNAVGLRYGQGSTIGNIISDLLLYIFPLAGLILLIFIIIGGFKFMTSAGDPKAAQSARGVITTAFIGFIIIFLAYWLTRIIATALGLGQIISIF